MTVQEYPITNVKIADLKLDPDNPNQMTKDQEQALKKAMKRFGYLVPIVINENMEIGDGQHRLSIYKDMGLTEIPAYIVPKINDDIERRLLRQTMNKLRGEHEIKMDADEIALIFQNNKLNDLSELLAQQRNELEDILTKHKGIQFQREDNFDVDKELEDLVPVTELGDIWQLGEHRIVCGDNSDDRIIKKLLEDKKVDLVVTSPPYDDLREYGGYEFDFETVAKTLYNLLSDGGIIVWVVGDAVVDGSETGSSFKQALHFKDLGFNLHDTMIYHKGAFRYPDKSRYYQAFEYMFILSKGEPKTFNPIEDRENIHYGEIRQISDRKIDGHLERHKIEFDKPFGVRHNVWTIFTGFMNASNDKNAYKHPAIFPEVLARDQIKSWSNENAIVFDPFIGSGTTLIASNQLNRICYGVEIDPRYIDIICKRYQGLTGKDAIRLKDNKTYNELKLSE